MDGYTADYVEDFGPRTEVGQHIFKDKYALEGEYFRQATGRMAAAMADDEAHRKLFLGSLRKQVSVPAGRNWVAMGSPRSVTAQNCFASGTIMDSLSGDGSIMHRLDQAAVTMQKGGGIGFDFSTLRPEGATIKSLGSRSSGPISFMEIYDKLCGAIASAGNRRGAMMATMRCDHPDILKFIGSKQNNTTLTNFNISVACTDKFMDAVRNGDSFDLVFDGEYHSTVDARALWDTIMRNTWDYAEPGVLFIDRMNAKNNLHYCETIATTNPCSEQPLPPFGACLLGSINLAKLVRWDGSKWVFDYDAFRAAIPVFASAMDNVIDRTIYPLPEQKSEAENKRRMGIGILGTANAIEACGLPYGTDGYIEMQSTILRILRDECYQTSIKRSKNLGSFPMFERDKYLNGEFIKTLPDYLLDGIQKHGIRNSHLTSIAPTGTVSLFNDNTTGGIEPVFSYKHERDIRTSDGAKKVMIMDYGVSQFGVYGRRSDDVSAKDHVRVMAAAQEYVDSSVSKTCNVGEDVTFPEFREIYQMAYDLGAKGCTTFRAKGKRFGVIRSLDRAEPPTPRSAEGEACTIDSLTGHKTCS